MRNGFELISQFFSFVFSNQDKGIKPYHISLYVFLWNQDNRLMWVEWFKCPFDLGMMGSGINSKHTYYKALADLSEWGLIEYQKGINDHKAPMVKLAVHKCTSTVPQSEPLPIPLLALQAALLPIPLQGRNIKLLTDNLEKVTSNIDLVLGFLKNELEESNPLNGLPQILDQVSEFNPELTARIRDATEKIAAFFNISEIKQPNHWMKIRKFIEFQARKDNLGYLADQFTSYRKLKEKKGFKHTWMNWIGQPSDQPEPYSEGAWNEQNWPKALEDHSQPVKTVSSVNYGDLHNKTLKLVREDTPIILQVKKPNNPL